MLTKTKTEFDRTLDLNRRTVIQHYGIFLANIDTVSDRISKLHKLDDADLATQANLRSYIDLNKQATNMCLDTIVQLASTARSARCTSDTIPQTQCFDATHEAYLSFLSHTESLMKTLLSAADHHRTTTELASEIKISGN